MRIGIEARTLMPGAGGIGRYTVHLLRALFDVAALCPPVPDFVLFTAPQTYRPLLHGYETMYQESFWPVKSSLLRSLLVLPTAIMQQHVQVFHGLDQAGLPWVGRRARHIVTLHDVLPLLFPYLFTRKHAFVVRTILARVARQADIVIVPSYAVRQDVVQHLAISEDRVMVIAEGCESRFQAVTDAVHLDRVRKKYSLPDEYILSLGTLEPRKNLVTVLKAFAQLRTQPEHAALQLVVAGPRGWGTAAMTHTVQALGLEKAVIFPGFIAEEDLPAVYSGAALFVFPSLYEGFGLPVLEAMGCGVPVITSNLSALPEVAGDSAVLVSPGNSEELAAAMEDVLHQEDLRQELRQKGLERVRGFSWERTAQKTLEVYRLLSI